MARLLLMQLNSILIGKDGLWVKAKIVDQISKSDSDWEFKSYEL